MQLATILRTHMLRGKAESWHKVCMSRGSSISLEDASRNPTCSPKQDVQRAIGFDELLSCAEVRLFRDLLERELEETARAHFA